MSAPSALRTPWLPKLVLAPSFLLSFVFIYGLIAWNGYLSLSASRLLPNYEFVGFEQYTTLFASERWWVALTNLAIFGLLYIGGAMAIGLLLAILLDKFHGRLELPTAVALDRSEHIARHALRVNSNQSRCVRAQLALDENNKLFRRDELAKADDAKLTRLSRQPCFGNSLDCLSR